MNNRNVFGLPCGILTLIIVVIFFICVPYIKYGEASARTEQETFQRDLKSAAEGLEKIGAKPGALIICNTERGQWIYIVIDGKTGSLTFTSAYVNDGRGSDLWHGSRDDGSVVVVNVGDAEYETWRDRFIHQVRQDNSSR